MKPSQIFSILDLARRTRELNKNFAPLFSGPPGLGKSEIIQQWCKLRGLPFIDLRLAYLESVDLIGFPMITTIEGRQVTAHITPEFLPPENWEGVIILEEVNRATTSVMNTLMQMLTDRKIHKYTLPKKALIVGAINEGPEYDVNTMDPALKDRFEIFPVSYDKESFVEHMWKTNYHTDIINFVTSGIYQYSAPEDVKNVPGSKYVSPRTLSKLDAALQSEVATDDEILIYSTVLGSNIGKDFYNFRHDESPVMYAELLSKEEHALARLKIFSNPDNFKNGMISLTIKDIVENKDISDALLAKVLTVLPFDQGTALVFELEIKREASASSILTRICKDYPALKEQFSAVKKHTKKNRKVA